MWKGRHRDRRKIYLFSCFVLFLARRIFSILAARVFFVRFHGNVRDSSPLRHGYDHGHHGHDHDLRDYEHGRDRHGHVRAHAVAVVAAALLARLLLLNT